jgi:Lipid A core - O-antigen ligase and related enzymes
MKPILLMDEQAGLLSKKDKLLYGLVTAFLLTLYLPHIPVITNIIFGAIALLSFSYNSWEDKRRLLRQRKEVLIILLFYLLHIISALISDNIKEGFSYLVLRLPLLAFILVLGWIYMHQALKERILFAYIIITTMVLLFCMVWQFIQYQATGNAALLYNDSLTDIIERQSVYVANMVNLAIFSLIYLLSIKSAFLPKQIWVYAVLLVLLVANFLLASRIGITILYGTLFCLSLFYIIKKRKFLAGAAFVLALAAAGFLLVKAFPKTINRFRELGYTHYEYSHRGMESHYNMQVTPDQWNGANIRLAVWNCGWELVKQHPVFGVQVGDKMDELMQVYADKQFNFAYASRRNLHNTYLDVLVALGAVGLIVFLAGFFVIPFIKSIHTHNLFGMLVIPAFALSLVSETYLDRSLGNMLLAFFIGFVISCRKPV